MTADTKKIINLFFIYVCIFSVSLFYRFYDLDRHGFFPGSDAPGYAGVVKTYRAGLDYLVRNKILSQHITNVNEYLYENGGQIGTAAKDGLIPIGLTGSIIFGNNNNTILYTSAAFGVLTVLLLFFILSRRINLLYSFMLVLLFAVSPYHIGFSREGLTGIYASFFLLAGIYLYIKSLGSSNFKYLYLCGLFLGCGFLCHYNIAPFIFVFFAYEACCIYLKRSNLKRIFILFVSLAIPLFLAELFTSAVKLYGIRHNFMLIDKFHPYFKTLFIQLIDVRGGGTDIQEGPFYYFKNLLYHEGIIPSILLIISFLFILRKGRKINSDVSYFLLLVFLLPFNYYLWFQESITDRAMLSFIPLGYFIIGYGLNDFGRYKKLFMLLIFIAILVSGFRSLDYLNYRSNFEQAVNYMQRNKGVKHVTSTWSLSRLYVGRKNAVFHAELPYSARLTPVRSIVYQINPVNINRVKALYNNGFNYLVLNIPPSVTNDLTEAATHIPLEYSTDTMICNDRGDGYDPALLRDKNGRYLFHFNVYDLGKVINFMEKDKNKNSLDKK